MSYETDLRLTTASVNRYTGDMDDGLRKAASRFVEEAYRVLLSRGGPVAPSRVYHIPPQNVRCLSCGVPQLAPGGKIAHHKWLPPGAKRAVTCVPKKKKKGPK